MFLLVFVLEKVELLPDLSEGLLDAGVKGATVIDSLGMGRILLEEKPDLPLSHQIEGVVSGKVRANKTIFSVISDETTLEAAKSVIRKTCGNLEERGTGILFTIKLAHMEGISS